MCRGNLVRQEIEIIYCERYSESEKGIYLCGVPVGEFESKCVVDLVAKLAFSASLAHSWLGHLSTASADFPTRFGSCASKLL